MLNRTEPYVPEGGAYLPEREPFVVPVEPERTADEYEDYGADQPADEQPPRARCGAPGPAAPGLEAGAARRGQAGGRCWDSRPQVR